MPSDGDSFLPRIQSVFYSVFDVRQGPKIVYQVPEGLIAVPPPGLGNVSVTQPSTPLSDVPDHNAMKSRNSSTSFVSTRHRNSRSLQSPHKRSASSNRILFNFDDISKYVIPPSTLCGRLVTCATSKHRIIGFPVELRGDYERNYFRYNLCFVFERSADLSCYEPVVRKVSRVLTSCEEESAFLSSPITSPTLHAILEQLYEDLNSYSETSISIDRFNSIELKIFPFYPNPPAVHDWMVPLALINLSKRIESNWDLTIVKVCRFIDGINHVSRIAHLADCDLDLTRQAISHLLYYQVIMTIDIFQYSNIYILRKNIQWLAEEAHVKEECGLYVTKPGRPIPDWPKLLHLYSRLKPGKTVLEWMTAYEVHSFGIDVRRFTSFGVIKGFLRRVHRWPVLHKYPSTSNEANFTSSIGRRRGKSASMPSTPLPPIDVQPTDANDLQGRNPGSAPIAAPLSPEPPARAFNSATWSNNITRRASAAETVLEQLRSRDIQKSATISGSSTRNSWTSHPRDETQEGYTRESRRHSLASPPPPSPSLSSQSQTTLLGVTPTLHNFRPRPSLTHTASSFTTTEATAYPAELLSLLDGEHHTDELATRFEAGWPLLEQWLASAGGGKGDGDFGQVSIIYR